MKFFKKKKQEPIFDLEKLLQQDDPVSIIMEIDGYLNTKSNYGDSIEKLTQPQTVLLYVENLEREVNNGGFNQFYFNSSGDFSHETYDALMTIGAIRTAEVVKTANDEFPDGKVPKGRAQRQEILRQIEDPSNEVWGKCDNYFYHEIEDHLIELLLEYVKKNKTEFEE